MAKDVNLTSQEWCDIVFEEKNKKYGAYQLRRNSSKRHIIALIAMLAFIVFVAFLPSLVQTVVEATRPKSDGLTESTVLAELKELEEQAKNEQAQLPATETPPPPLKSTIKFTPPVITDSKDMTDEDNMKSQTDLAESKTQIGKIDHQGTTDDPNAVDPGDLIEHKQIVEEPAGKVWDAVEQMPVFPGGDAELLAYLYKNIKYPEDAKNAGISGKVYVKFVVNSKGEVDKVQILRSPHPSLSAEATRVIKSMPKWIPGKQNGVAVSTYFSMPINFTLK